MRSLILSLTVAVGIAAGIFSPNFGCGETEAAFDCAQICNKYQECGNASYDVSACTSRCRNSAEDDTAFQNKADACEDCIDDRSCIGAVFNCGTECAGIVP